MNKKLAIIAVLCSVFLILGGLNSSFLYGIEYMSSKSGYDYAVSSTADWWNCNWSYCKKITIDHTKIESDQTDFPVLLNESADADLAANAQADGDDIVFVNIYNTTQYSHEIEEYDSATGALSVWVKVTSLSSTTDTILYMYYGNPTCSNQQNVTDTWDDNFIMVQHLNESSMIPLDSTSNNNDGTNNGATFNSSSKIDGGYDFGGSADVNVGNDSSLNITSSITLEGWVKDPPFFIPKLQTKVQIVDKKDERLPIVPGKPFTVERTISTNKNTELIFVALFSPGIKIKDMNVDQESILEGIYTKDKPNSDIAKRIENIRTILPDKIKELRNIAYSKPFTIDNIETIKMSFDTEWQNPFNNGRISYLVITSDGTYDYETTTHWKNQDLIRKIIEKYPSLRRLLNRFLSNIDYFEIEPEDAKEIVESDDNALILDIRNEKDYDTGHVENSISVSLDDMSCSPCLQNMLEEYKNSRIIVYGDNIIETKQAYEILVEQNYKFVYYSTDSIASWRNAGFNIVSSQAEINVETEIDQILNNGKSALLFFYSNDCNFCQKQKPVLTNLSESYADALDIVYLHNNENPLNFEKYNIKSYPTMFLVADKNGSGYTYKDFTGFTDKDTLINVFDMVLDSDDDTVIFDSWWHGPIEHHRPLGLPLTVAARVSHGEEAQVIIKYKDGRNVAEETAQLKSLGFVPTAEIPSKSVVAGTIDLEIYNEIKYDNDILAVYPDENFTVLLNESLPLIRYDDAVDEFGVTGSGKKICILDTGVDSDLVGYSYGYDFVNDDPIPDDEHGHGTKVAAVIKSIAPDSELIVAKVIGASGVGFESDVLEALEWCIDQKPDIISFSIGSEGSCSGFCDINLVASMSNDAVDNGVFVVAAAGNDGQKSLKSPACGSKVFSVGATDDNDTIAGFSNVNPTLDMFAPGVNITTVAGGGSGTSFSAPFVAGAALLVLEHENLNPIDLKYRLKSTGKSINYTYNETISLSIPRLDIYNALNNNKTMEPYNYSWWWQSYLTDEEYQILPPTLCSLSCASTCGAGWTGACSGAAGTPCEAPCDDDCSTGNAGCFGDDICICNSFLNAMPTITSASISDRDDTDNCYAMNEYYSFVAVVNDMDGATDLDEVHLRGKDGAVTRFEVKVTGLASGSGSWSITSGSDVIDLDTGSCSWVEDGFEGTATFEIRFEWDHVQNDDCEIAVYVEDDDDASAGWTDMQTNYFDIINRLVTTSFAASDGRINRGGSATLSGNVRYATTTDGSTASSSCPPNGEFTAVRIHDSSHSVQCSDTVISSGAFSCGFSIPDAVQSNSYHVYLDMDPDFTDGDAADGDEVSVIGDQVKVTNIVVSDYTYDDGSRYWDANSAMTITYTAVFDYDESAFDGELNAGYSGDTTAWGSTSSLVVTPNDYSAGNVVTRDDVTAGSVADGGTHGITSLSVTATKPEVGWDGEVPSTPSYVLCSPDSYGTGGETDDDTEIYVNWSGEGDGSGSGVDDYYMEYNDNTPEEEAAGGDQQDTDIGAAGLCTFYVRGKDNVGNWGTSASDTITIDLTVNTAPWLKDGNETPANTSTNIDVCPVPALYVVCWDNDTGDTMNATWRSNSSGPWVTFASNTSIANNTNITQTNSNFSNYSTTYYWSVNLSDGNGGWNNETYHFTTEAISTSVDTITPYEQTTTPLSITATGDSCLDNVTLYYRYSSDNSTWWNSSWTYREKLTIDHDQVAATLSNFPILVNITDSNLSSKAQSDGDDIVFTNATGTKLNHEIESYTSGTGNLIAWVNVTSLSSSSDTEIYMYYGNSTCSSQQNPTGVWNINYTAVWHLTDNTTSSVNDSTSNSNDGTKGSANNPQETTGHIDKGQSFSSDYIDCGNVLDVGSKLTVEAWIKDTGSSGGNVVGKYEANDKRWHIFSNSGGDNLIYWNIGGSNYGSSSEVDTNWHHLTMVYDGTQSGDAGRLKAYVDGVNTSLSFTGEIPATMPAISANVNIGRHSTANYFDGIIDEARISDTARSAAWVITSYNTMNNQSTFLSTGSEESWMLAGGTNPDTNGDDGWSWSFDFDSHNGTGYYEFYSIGKKTGSTNETPPNGADAKCYYNPPTATVPTVVTNASTGVEETNATLRGYLSNNGSADTTCGFRYGTSSGSYPNNITHGIVANGTEFSNDTTGLTQGQIYFYQAWANNSAGFANGSEQVFLTKPEAPTSLTAQTNSSSVIYLTWNTGTGYNTTYIERNQTGVTVWARGAGTEIYNDSGTQYEDSGLTNGTTYYYQAWSYANWTYNPTLYQYSDANASGSNTTKHHPAVTNENPTNTSSDISLNPTLSVQVNHSNGYQMNISWYWGTTASCPNYIGTNSTVSNGTYSQPDDDSNFSSNSQTYYWKVIVNDGHGGWTNETYWFTTIGANKEIISKGQSAYSLEMNPGGTTLYGYINGNSVSTSIDSNWHYVTITYDNTNLKIYKDGEYIDSTSIGGDINTNSNNLTLGEYMTGTLDELRISNTAREAEWINTTYQNTNSPTTFATFGTQIGSLTAWSYRKKIWINASMIDNDLTNFPVLISTTDNDLKNNAHSSGNDIIFTNSSVSWTTGGAADRLAHEIEKWDKATGELVAWVNVTSVSSTTNTSIYMYYGSICTNNIENAAGVWDSNYKMVQHLNETSDPHEDSTSYNNDGNETGGVNQSGIGKIDGCDWFDGSDDQVSVPDSSSLDITSQITLEAWINDPFNPKKPRGLNNPLINLPALDKDGYENSISAFSNTAEDTSIDELQDIPKRTGYEFLNDDKVLHIWNEHNSYYFNTSSWLQLTNHYEEYWTHNVLKLGYYNKDEWNSIYQTDKLPGYNRNITTDKETYVNITLWKNLSYSGYDFRLSIRYHLGVNDSDLTIIPYIKNLGSAIPYELVFGWEIKDIQIDMTPEYDCIEIDGISYYLNETLDNTYKNMTNPIFYITEDKGSGKQKILYLKWNETLDYTVQVKSRDSQYNAPITLFIKVGTLSVGQEKFTKMHWLDADQHTYVCDDIDAQGYEGIAADGGFNDGSENEFLDGDYTNIDGDDNDYVQDSSVGDNLQYHRFDFTIDESVSSITQIDVTWRGVGGMYGGPVSFPGDTQVRTSVGDLTFLELYKVYQEQEILPLISYLRDGKIYQGHIRKVTQNKYAGDLIILTLSNGEEIYVTPGHPILTDAVKDEYIEAEKLTVGAKLPSLPPENITVTEKKIVKFNGHVYNLDVREFHNFLLSSGLFVHNELSLNVYGHSLWVKESGSWVEKDLGTATSKETLTVQYTSGFDTIISSGHMHVGAQSDEPGGPYSSALNSYYVEVVVTYVAANNAPTVSSPSPTNQSTGVSISTSQLTVSITDDDGDLLNWTIETSPNIGSQDNSSSSEGNGTKTCSVSGLSYDTTYYWYVNASDGTDWTNKTYWFTTVGEPGKKIVSKSQSAYELCINGSTLYAYINSNEVNTSIDETWRHVVLTYDGATLKLYVDGTVNASDSLAGAINTNNNDVSIGTVFSGDIDEVRISNIARNASWINASFKNQNDTSNFTAFGGQEIPNVAPTQSSPNPSDGATGQSLNPTLSITVNDTNIDAMNVTFRTNATDSWGDIGTNSSVYNGTYSQTNSSMNNYNTTYYWSVNVTDGTTWSNATYSFNTSLFYSVTFNDPYEDGHVRWEEFGSGNYFKNTTGDDILIWEPDVQPSDDYRRGYVEWNISSIPDSATILDVDFLYHGHVHNSDCKVYDVDTRPSTWPDETMFSMGYTDLGDGSEFANINSFPVAGANQEIDLNASAESDLQGRLSDDWWAIGITAENATVSSSSIYSENYSSVDPTPSIRVNYTVSSSPYLYTFNEGRYTYISDFIPGATTPQQEYTHHIDITDKTDVINGKVKLKITEELDEITYLDQIYLIVDDDKITPTLILKPSADHFVSSLINKYLLGESDDQYLIMKHGDEYFLEFNVPPSSADYDKLEFVAEGYYIKHSSEGSQ